VGQFAYSRLGEDLSPNPAQSVAHSFANRLPWQEVQRLTETGASAVGLPEGLLVSNPGDRHSASTLVPVRDAIRRFEGVRLAAETMNNQLLLFGCTNAREARSLTTDDDPRDLRYLSGTRAMDGSHVYCGSIDAAVSRALAYAPYVDVISYRTTSLNLQEAERFASAIRASSPNRPLGICFPFQGGLDGVSLNRKLTQLGYRYHFLTLSESLIVPEFAQELPWALFDDGAKAGF